MKQRFKKLLAMLVAVSMFSSLNVGDAFAAESVIFDSGGTVDNTFIVDNMPYCVLGTIDGVEEEIRSEIYVMSIGGTLAYYKSASSKDKTGSDRDGNPRYTYNFDSRNKYSNVRGVFKRWSVFSNNSAYLDTPYNSSQSSPYRYSLKNSSGTAVGGYDIEKGVVLNSAFFNGDDVVDSNSDKVTIGGVPYTLDGFYKMEPINSYSTVKRTGNMAYAPLADSNSISLETEAVYKREGGSSVPYNIIRPKDTNLKQNVSVKPYNPEDNKPSNITVSPNSIAAEVGDTIQLSGTISPNTLGAGWSSSAPAIASIVTSTAGNGIGNCSVKANAPGQAFIYLRSSDGSASSLATVTVKGKVIPVTGITNNPATSVLSPGGMAQVTATVSPNNAGNKKVLWTSSNNSVATVSSTGLITAKANGTADIVATTEDGGYKAVTVVTVSTSVTGVTMSPATLALPKGGTYSLSAEVVPQTASNSGLSWTSSAPSIVSVNSSGNLVALSTGSAVIIASSKVDASKKANCTVTVSNALTQITLNKKEATLEVGGNLTLTANTVPAGHTSGAIVWESSNTGVAVVNNGLVTAVGAGTAIIKAKNGAIYDTCEVKVAAPVTGVTMNPTAIALPVNTTYSLSAEVTPQTASNTALSWSSSNPSIVSVNNSGSIVTLSTGVATITATSKADGSKKADCVVTVNNTLTQITLNKHEISTRVGENFTLTANTLPADHTSGAVIWESSNTSVATVSNGLVKPVGAGTAIIKAKNGSVSDTCEVGVSVPVSGVVLDNNSFVLDIGNTRQLNATVQPVTAADQSIKWSTSNSDVVTVNEYGLITAVGSGIATVTVRTNDGGFTADCLVQVNVPVLDIDMTETTITLDVGTEYTMSASTNQTAVNKAMDWSVSNSSLVKFKDPNTGIGVTSIKGDLTGEVTIKALKPGDAVVTVKSQDGGLRATCNVSVIRPVSQLQSSTNKLELIYDEPENARKPLRFDIIPALATNSKITAWSNNNSIVNLDTVRGDITLITNVSAVNLGNTTIEAWDGGEGHQVIVDVEVIQPVRGFALSQESISVYEGETIATPSYSFTPVRPMPSNTNLIWSSSNPSVASVQRSTGTTQALSQGIAVITAVTEDGGFSDSFTVTVNRKSTSIDSLKGDEFSVLEGTDISSYFKVLPETSTDLSMVFQSSDTDVIGIGEDGNPVVKSKGNCTLKITSGDGFSTKTVKVAVIRAVTGIALSTDKNILAEGDTAQLSTVVTPDTASNTSVIYSSKAPDIASVDAAGVVTALKAGSAVIEAKISDVDLKDTVEITVIRPVSGVSIDTFERPYLFAGETQQFSATITPADATESKLKWTSSDENVATVVQDTGLLTAVSDGTITLTVTSESGQTDTVDLLVKSIDSLVFEAVQKSGENAIQITSQDTSIMEYGLCSSTSDQINWKEDNLFENLEWGQSYHAYVKTKSGFISDPLEVTVKDEIVSYDIRTEAGFKSEYFVNEAFNNKDIFADIIYASGATDSVSNVPVDCTDFDSASIGSKELTIDIGKWKGIDLELTAKLEYIVKSLGESGTVADAIVLDAKAEYGLKEQWKEKGVLRIQYSPKTRSKAVSEIPLSEPMIEGFDTTSPGLHTAMVTYDTVEAKYDYWVVEESTPDSDKVIPVAPDREVQALRVSDERKNYKLGDELDRSEGYAELKYDDGYLTKLPLNSDQITFSGFDSATIGSKTIHVSYKDKTAEYEIRVEDSEIPLDITKPVSSISVVDPKTEYKLDDDFDTKTGKVVIYYTDGYLTKLTLDSEYITLSGFDSATIGSKTIQVSYKDKTAEYEIQVGDSEIPLDITKPVSSISVVDPKTEYQVGDELDQKTGKVMIYYTDGYFTKLSMDSEYVSISGFSTDVVGEKEVTVSYQSSSAHYMIQVNDDSQNSSSTVTSLLMKDPKIKYRKGDAIDKEIGLVVVYYKNGDVTSIPLSTNGVTFDGFDTSTVGTKTVTVTYLGAKTTYDIVVSGSTAGGDKEIVDGDDGFIIMPDGIIVTPLDPDNPKRPVVNPEDNSVKTEDSELTLPNGTQVTPEGNDKDTTINGDGTISIPGGTVVDKGDITITYPGPVVIDKNGNLVSPPDASHIIKDNTTGSVTIMPKGTTVTPPEGGSIIVKPDGTVIAPGGSTVTDNDGNKWDTDGTTQINPDGKKPGSGSGSAGGGGGGGSSSANKTYDISINMEGRGKSDKPGTTKVNGGDDFRAAFIPEQGYEVSEILVNEKHQEPTERFVLRDVQKDFRVNVKFKAIEDIKKPINEKELLHHDPYISGYPDGTIRPNDYMTREEVAQMLSNAVQMSGESAVSFSDIGKERWSASAVSSLAGNGVVNGYPDGRFYPVKNITRAEFMVMVARLKNVTGKGNGFADLDTHWAKEYILALQGSNYITGYSDGTIRPNHFITRAEAVSITNNVLNRSPETGSEGKKFLDNAKDQWYYLDIIEAATDHNFVMDGSNENEIWN